MTSTRLNMSQEGQLWKIALKQFGSIGLNDFVVKQWAKAGSPGRATVEYLDIEFVGKEVLSILRTAQMAVGAAAAPLGNRRRATTSIKSMALTGASTVALNSDSTWASSAGLSPLLGAPDL